MSRFCLTTKRFVAVAAVASMSFLSACSNNSDDGAAATSDPAETSTSEAAAPVDEVTIYLTRHGKTWLNTVDRVQGWSDSPLTDAGAEVATKLGDLRQPDGPRRMITSPARISMSIPVPTQAFEVAYRTRTPRTLTTGVVRISCSSPVIGWPGCVPQSRHGSKLGQQLVTRQYRQSRRPVGLPG